MSLTTNLLRYFSLALFFISASHVGAVEIIVNQPVQTGGSLTVSFSNVPAGSSVKDWIGLYPVGKIPGQIPSLAWKYTQGAASGTQNYTAPSTAGNYVFFYCLNDGYTCNDSAQFTVSLPPPPPAPSALPQPSPPSMTLDSTSVAPGLKINVSWKNAPPGSSAKDWIGLYPEGKLPGQIPSLSWQYTQGAGNGTQSYTAPSSAGNYTFFYCLNDGYSCSNSISLSVVISPSPAPSPTLLPSIPPVSNSFDLTRMKYQGSFRPPVSYSYGGTAIAYNPVSDSLFLTGHEWYQQTAEISIPTPAKKTTISELPRGVFLRNFFDATDGRLSLIDPDQNEGKKIGGMMVYKNELITSAYVYYDGAGNATASHFVSNLDLSIPNDAQGPFRVGNMNPGFVGGYMCQVPDTMQSMLGGPALTGLATIAIIGRTSLGPAAFAFNPEHLGEVSPVPATPILYYPITNNFGSFTGTFDPKTNPWNAVTQFRGIFIDEKTSSVIFLASQGLGPVCYKDDCGPYNNGGYATTTGQSTTGLWVYKASELEKVRLGTIKPWEAKLEAWYELKHPFGGSTAVGGAALDSTRKLLYISQVGGDTVATYDYSPLIHVYSLE